MKKTKLVNQQGFRMWKSGKQWLTSGAVAGVTVISMAGGTVLADEALPVSSLPTPAAETTGVAVTESTITNETPTGNASTNLIEAAAGNSVDGAAADASAGTVTGETPVTIDHTGVTTAAQEAEAVGVDVVQDPTSVAPTASTASEAAETKASIVAQETSKAEELKSTATAYSTAVSEWTDTKTSIVAFNADLDKAHLAAVDAYNSFVNTLNADTAAVLAQHKDAIIQTTEKIQSSADGTTVEGYQAYLKELADQQALNKTAIEQYLVKKSEVNSLSTKSSEIAAKNASLSASVVEESKRLSLSASVVVNESIALSESAQKVNDEANAYNKSVMESRGLAWTGDFAKDSATVEAYNNSDSGNTSSAFDKASAAGKDTLPNDSGHNGYTPSGSTTHHTAQTLGNYELVSSGKLDNPTVYIKSSTGRPIDKSKVIKSIVWGNTPLEALDGGTLYKGTYGQPGYYWTGAYNYNAGGNTNQIWTIQNLKWYRIKNAITMMDGSVHDAIISTHTDSGNLYRESKETFTDGNHAVVWNADGAINSLDGFMSPRGVSKGDGIRLRIRVDSVDNKTNYLFNTVISDLDNGQFLDGPIEYSKILAVGGGMATDSFTPTNVASHEDLGITYGVGRNNNSLNGLDSAPDGTAIISQYGIEYNTIIRNTPGGRGSAVARADFGTRGNANITFVTQPIALKPLAEYNPANSDYTPPTYTPEENVEVPAEPVLQLVEITAPADPEFKEIPPAPETPTVHYHLTALNSNTPVNKTVENEDGVDINNQSVAKGSVNTFTLSPQPLVAGRPITTSLVYSDYIDDGLEINIAKSQADNTNFEISFDEKTRLLEVRGTSAELALSNADRSKEYTPSAFKITYTVLNDAATYTNTFRMDVNGGATGNVIVEHYIEGTNILIDRYVDTEESPVGESYDTTDFKPTVVAKDGKTYKLVSTHVEGEETGEVIDGDKLVKYFYTEVTPEPGKGNVIRHFEDEDGNPIHPDTVDTENGNVGDPYDTSDGIEDIEGYELVPSKTKGNETGKVVEGTTEVTYVYKRLTPKPTPGNGYTSYSNKVIISTPGGKDNPNDPDNPNGGGNEKIQPVKNNTNEEGANINGKTLLQNDVNHYVAEWDLDQYINDKSSKSAIAKGFAYIDNPQDDALTGIESEFKVVDAKGNAVEGLTFYKANSAKLGELPKSVQNLIANSELDVSDFGDFYIWVADDSQAFYDTYVQTGTDVFFNLPMRVTKGFVGDYTNQTYQIDFGNGYTGNIVENDVPDLVPKKDVIVDGSSVDGQTIAYGQEFKYLLKGAVIPGNRGEALWEYKYIDDYDQTGDKFLETYGVKATTDIAVVRTVTLEADAVYEQDVTLENGTVIKAGETIPKGTKLTITEVIAKGSDLTKFTTMEHDVENGIVTISFTEEFLASVVDDSEFGADATLDFKRIAYGTFENTYINRVNGVDYISNTVKTSTPAPVVPTTPGTPGTPAKGGEVPSTPVAPAAVLPETGDSNSKAGLIGGLMAMISGLGLLISGKRRKEN